MDEEEIAKDVLDILRMQGLAMLEDNARIKRILDLEKKRGVAYRPPYVAECYHPQPVYVGNNQ